MKLNLKETIVLTLLFIQSTVIAQFNYDPSLLNKYWVYKDRYLKHFVHVGRLNGQSTPVIKITKEDQFVIDGNSRVEKKYTGKVEFGDAMVDQGNYLAALATEYRLLKNTGKDVTAILNELYYAIETINRLDKFAEEYFNNSTPNLNGFFVRTDVPPGLYKDWEVYGDPVHFQKSDCGSGRFSPDNQKSYFSFNNYMWKDDNGDFIKEDWNSGVVSLNQGYDYINHKGYGNRVNEQSQDHTFGLLFGLAFVNKFVDNEYVKPIKTGINADRGFKIIDEVKHITYRIINRLAARKTEAFGQITEKIKHKYQGGIEGFFPNGDFVSKVSADWLVVNTTNNKVVYRGPSATQLGFTYPAIVAASKILGYTPPEWEVDNVMDIWYNRTVATLIPAPTIPPPVPLGGLWSYFKNVKYQFPVKPQNITWWAIFGNSSLLSFYNRNHIWKLATISGLVDQQDFHDFCTPNKTYIEIINAVFNGVTPIKSKSYYTDILLNSICDGTRHYNHPPDYSRLQYWGTEDLWSFSDHLDENGHPKQGEFNGLDYMLMHNLYRLAFVSNTPSTYSTNTCPCTSSNSFAPNSSNVNKITSINSLKEDLPFRFPDYKKYNIEIPEWLTQNFTINSNGILKPQGDLFICGSTTTVNSNGKLLEIPVKLTT